jgi:hypothetical protein
VDPLDVLAPEQRGVEVVVVIKRPAVLPGWVLGATGDRRCDFEISWFVPGFLIIVTVCFFVTAVTHFKFQT